MAAIKLYNVNNMMQIVVSPLLQYLSFISFIFLSRETLQIVSEPWFNFAITTGTSDGWGRYATAMVEHEKISISYVE